MSDQDIEAEARRARAEFIPAPVDMWYEPDQLSRGLDEEPAVEGCQAMCCIAAADWHVGITRSVDSMNACIRQLVADGYIAPNMTVWPGPGGRGYAGVITRVLRSRGSGEICNWIPWNGGPAPAHDFRLRVQYTGVAALGGMHATLRDRADSMIYDPGRGQVPDLGVAYEVLFEFVPA